MKKLASVLAAAAISFALGWTMVSHRLTSEYAARLTEQQANWEAERAALEAVGQDPEGKRADRGRVQEGRTVDLC